MSETLLSRLFDWLVEQVVPSIEPTGYIPRPPAVPLTPPRGGTAVVNSPTAKR
jgi:hypothetical protein